MIACEVILRPPNIPELKCNHNTQLLLLALASRGYLDDRDLMMVAVSDCKFPYCPIHNTSGGVLTLLQRNFCLACVVWSAFNLYAFI